MNVVEVYASVTDARGEPIAGLTAADFGVEEDGVPQRISTFAAGEFPLSVALGLDRSFSVHARQLQIAATAAAAFVRQLRSSDQVMVLGIGSEIERLAPLSTNHAAAIDALAAAEPWGTTPLHDATLEALDAIQAGSGRRALILISDGVDRYSRTTPTELVRQARRRDVLVYPVITGRTRQPLFVELAAVSGGRSFQAPNARSLSDALASIARELRHQYLLGYTPAETSGSGWRSIRVTVNRRAVRVRARDGYYAGTAP